MKNRFARPITTTLILATALVTFGCKQPLQGADMANKPLVKQEEPDVKPERKALDAVPVLQKDANPEKSERKKHYELSPPKKVVPPHIR